MRKKLLILAVSTLLILLALRLTAKYWIGWFINAEPREPKYEIPITYNIGWQSYQNTFEIDTFSVELVESQLNLFNSYSLIKYHIKGRLVRNKNNWEPYIKQIHISERVLPQDTLNTDTVHTMNIALNKDTTRIGEINIQPEAIIELTPVIKTIDNDGYKSGQIIEFDITNEHKIQSLHCGDNYIMIKCGEFEIPIILQQRK